MAKLATADLDVRIKTHGGGKRMLGSAPLWGPRIAQPEDDFAPIPNSRLLREPPRREWLVEDRFTRGSIALFSGDGGIGKSLLLQHLCTCAVLGRAWLGLKVEPGRAMFIGCEDDEDELHRRQVAINRTLGVDMEDVLEAGLTLHGRVGRDNTLSRLDRKTWRMETTDLFARILDACLRDGISYVVLDTATQMFAGNQNDEQQVVQFANQCRRLAVAIQGVVILTKHPSMSGRALGTGESGNVAWNNSVRTRLYLHRDKMDNVFLETMKSNYGRRGDKIPLRWERGCFVRIDEPAARDYYEPG
ncbi:MAG: AAA family ATPase [Patescibacteria group bacterium]|nr:AAA family ATPase [Patescibacteria group bacterium]